MQVQSQHVYTSIVTLLFMKDIYLKLNACVLFIQHHTHTQGLLMLLEVEYNTTEVTDTKMR